MLGVSTNVSRIASSVTLDITARAKRMAREGIDVVSFGAGEPDFDTPPHIKKAAIDAINEGFTKYTPSSGTPELREAIVRKFKEDNGLDYKIQQVVVSCGAKHSLFNIFQAILNEGDEVIIPAPYWVSYPEMVKSQGARPVYVETSCKNNFKVTAELVKSKVTKKTKGLILNSPSNPTGCVYNAGELEEIASLAVKYNFYVISDEIYEKLVYDGKAHVSIASLGSDIRDRTFVVNGVSKSYAMTGWRIGYAAGPSNVMEAIANLQSHATSNPSSISQRAALEALSGSQSCVEEMRLEFEKRRDYMVERIGRMRRISCVKPEGAFYLFCDVSGLKAAPAEIANRLLDKAGVAVVPGEAFGAPRSIRMSFAASVENIKKGLDRIECWINKHRDTKHRDTLP